MVLLRTLPGTIFYLTYPVTTGNVSEIRVPASCFLLIQYCSNITCI